MKIHEFAEKYGLAKRQVDYYTIKGLLHPEINTVNRYRDYGSVCEEEVKCIILAKMLYSKVNEENVNMIRFLLKNKRTIKYVQSEIELRFLNIKADYERAKSVISGFETAK